ncbi:MAG: hypothetical protein M3R32_05270 [Chloroflexota bacterium]|nr:hypothetical protein [Chloroflexota bacterium]
MFLLVAGIALCASAAAAAAVGLLNPHLISDRLPPEAVIDAPAVGGAAVALGVGTGLLGLAHLGTALALRRRIGAASTAGVVLAATMAVLSLGFAIAALVSVASGAAEAIVMLPAAIGLGGAVVGYSAATVAIIGGRKASV